MLIKKFEEQVERTPQAIAVHTVHTVLPVLPVHPTADTGCPCTYKKLNHWANQIAAQITAANVGPNVALLLEHGVNMIAAILGTLKAGKIYVPLSVDYPENRLSYLLSDSEAAIIITETAHEATAQKLAHSLKITTLNIDKIDRTPAPNPQRETRRRENAYILYTSGSTGKPKGVVQTHENADYYCRNWIRIFSITASDRMTLFSSFCHDGSVQDIFSALHTGAALYPLNMKNRKTAFNLSQYLNSEKITIWHSVPSLFTYFCGTLDGNEAYPHLRGILLGGEAVRQHEAAIRDKYFPHCILANVYGQTESSVNAISLIKPGENYNKPRIGTPLDETELYVIDKNDEPVEPLQSGEIVIASPYISPGYWKNPEATQKVFAEDEDGGKLYWTGDLGKLLVNDAIEFRGRRDFQIKIRGFRVELGEIETAILKYPDITETAAAARQDETGDKYIIAYYVAGRDKKQENRTQELREYIARELPDYMLPTHYVKLKKMPLTSTGKIDRKALPQPANLETGKQYTPPRNETEKKLAKIWTQILGMPENKIGIDMDFFHLGGHSLKATILIAHVHKEFEVEIPLSAIFKKTTIRTIAQHITKTEKSTFTGLEKAAEHEFYPLSPAQQRLYILQQLDEKGTGYNLPMVMELEGKLDIEKLTHAYKEMIRRHESLRTAFLMVEEKPVQKIHPEVEFSIETYGETYGKTSGGNPNEPATNNGNRAENSDTETVIRRFIRPFDLTRAPLLRVGLLIPGATHDSPHRNRHILMMDMHHIISDGTSNMLFINEFIALYGGESLPPLKYQYRDYSQWRNSDTHRTKIKRQEDYWLEVFSGEIPQLELPGDYPRPAVQGFEGSTLRFEIGPKETGALKKLTQTEGVTQYMLLLAGITIWLAKLSRQEDIIVGTPTAGRGHTDLERVIGMFVNTLALRNQPHGKKTFRQYLNHLKTNTLAAFENQDYQFEDIVEKVAVKRDTSRNPIFDFMLVLQNLETQTNDIPEVKIEALTVKPLKYNRTTARFDMYLTVVDAGEYLKFKLEYATALFKEETVKRCIRYYQNIVAAILENPQTQIAGIEILTGKEREEVLYTFNETTLDYPMAKNLHQLIREQAEKTPRQIAVVEGRHTTGDTESQSLTYAELNEKSARMAQALKEKGVKPGMLVGLMVSRTKEMITALLAVLKAGAAYVPIDPTYPGGRIDYILKQSHPRILLTETHLREKLRDGTFEGEILERTDLNGANNADQTHEGQKEQNATPSDPAYVIYTSGSTGNPKGVMVTHANVVNFITGMSAIIDFSPARRILAVTTLSFDIFVLETLLPLTGGMEIVVADEEQQMEARHLAKLIIHKKIDILQLTPSRLKLLLVDIETSGALKGITHLLVGGEAFPAHLLKAVKRACTGKIYNVYGPTETTVWSCVKELTNTETVNIGKPIANTQVYIMDRYLRPQPPGIAGELLIGGDGVTTGYYENPELTSEKFINYKTIARSSKLVDGKEKKKEEIALTNNHLYRTGDLARWRPDGELEFLGRLDHQVKIRGFRIEIEEIEGTLLTHKNLAEAVVVEKKDPSGENYLCAYIVTKGDGHEETSHQETQPDAATLRQYLSRTLPAYMIPAFFVKLEKIPVTPNGKIDRKALPHHGNLETGQQYTPPRNKIENKLVKIWTKILDIPEKKIGIDMDFFHLGGHSLKATILIAHIHKEFDVELPLASIFKKTTIREIAGNIQGADKNIFKELEKAEQKDYYPLSTHQKRLYLMQQLSKNGTPYNLPKTIPWEMELDENKMHQTFTQLIQRHESMRTTFHIIDGNPVQKVHPHVPLEIEKYKTGEKDNPEQTEKIIRNFIRPFRLDEAPLFRVGIIDGGRGKNTLLVDLHHIITDGSSHVIMTEEFQALYDGQELPPLKRQYKDFCQFQNSPAYREETARQMAYWQKELSGDIPALELRYDHPRPANQSFEGAGLHFYIAEKETEALEKMSRRQGSTLFITLAALIKVLLHKMSAQEDILMGIPTAGRGHIDLEKIIGMFVNTLVLRSNPEGNKQFDTYHNEVKTKTLSAFENSEAAFEEVVEKVVTQRDTGRNPLFDIMFVLQNQAEFKGQITGNTDEILPGNQTTAQFDITFQSVEVGSVLFFTMIYCTKLFKEKTIKRYIHYFKRIVSTVVQNPEQEIAQIDILSEKEKQQLLYEFNETATEYPGDKTIHELFEQQVNRTPDHIGTAAGRQLTVDTRQEEKYRLQETIDGKQRAVRKKSFNPHLTYRELNRRANRLAYIMIKKGVKPGAIVGIIAERSIEMLVGIMAILKTGAAYLPITPGYPHHRILFMLKDSNAALVLSDGSEPQTLDENYKEIKILNMKELKELNELNELKELKAPEAGIRYPASGIQPSSALTPTTYNRPPTTSTIAYIIYTSGSTGTPKGVLVEHHPVVNLLTAMQEKYTIEQEDTWLLKTSFMFDVSVSEIFGWFLGGGRIAILERDGEKDPQIILETIKTQKVTHINFVPAMFNAFQDYLTPQKTTKLESLKYIFLAGEALKPGTVQKFRQLKTKVQLENLYGPTEATVYATSYNLEEWNEKTPVPIGKPLQNTQLYILDKENRLQPVGIPGELYISGTGLASGYLNRPELTAERFTKNSGQLPVGSRQEKQKEKRQQTQQEDSIFSFPNNQYPITNNHFYRTGDIACWQPDGNIEYLGRIDHQIKIRGFRIETGEIENVLAAHHNIKEVVVLPWEETPGNQNLCAYYVETEKNGAAQITARELKTGLSQTLPNFMIPAYYVKIAQIPLTPNGKIDRKALPEPRAAKTGEKYAAPRTPVEEKLVNIWKKVLYGEKAGENQPAVGIDDSFFDLGGHSLKANRLVLEIHKELEVKTSLAKIFRTPTIRDVARHIEQAETQHYKTILPVEPRDYYPLSYNQQRLYLLQQLNPESAAFNIVGIVELRHEADEPAIRRTLSHLTQRHESLRTYFDIRDEQPAQLILPKMEPHLEIIDITTQSEEKKQQTIMHLAAKKKHVYELSQAPLWKTLLLKLEPRRTIFLYMMHHIITDGWSMEIFKNEFLHVYERYRRGEEAGQEPLNLQYKDYTQWHNRQLEGEEAAAALSFWKKTLTKPISILKLPTDSVSRKADTEGAAYKCTLPEKLKKNLKKLATQLQTTLFTVMFTVYLQWLSRRCHSKDIACSIIAAGRMHPELQPLIGFFVNPLIFRKEVDNEKDNATLIQEVHRQVMDVFGYQGYPMEAVFEQLETRYPEVPVSFNMLNLSETEKMKMPLIHHSQHKAHTQDVKYDLEIYATEYSDGILLHTTYKKSLFKHSTIEFIVQQYVEMLEYFAANPTHTLKNLIKSKKEAKGNKTKPKKTFKRG